MGGRISQRIDQAPTGDITEISVSNGVAGGGTTGVVSLTLDTDSKGDLNIGTGADTSSLLGVGSNDQVLTADSSEATGVKWAAVQAVLG
jgi:phage tail sheath gpL-like